MKKDLNAKQLIEIINKTNIIDINYNIRAIRKKHIVNRNFNLSNKKIWKLDAWVTFTNLTEKEKIECKSNEGSAGSNFIHQLTSFGIPEGSISKNG